MTPFFRAIAVLVTCCLMLGACQDKHAPLKPTVLVAVF